MSASVSINVNGQSYDNDIESRLLLVHYLRDILHLTGTHVGCDTSQCGACTVLMNGEAVKSCTVLAVQATGAKLLTVEGLADGENLHPIQAAFRSEHALQCGFCTPGMMMAIVQLLQRYPNPTVDQIRHQLDGNICRCTGYDNIIRAIQVAGNEITKRAVS